MHCVDIGCLAHAQRVCAANLCSEVYTEQVMQDEDTTATETSADHNATYVAQLRLEAPPLALYHFSQQFAGSALLGAVAPASSGSNSLGVVRQLGLAVQLQGTSAQTQTS